MTNCIRTRCRNHGHAQERQSTWLRWKMAVLAFMCLCGFVLTSLACAEENTPVDIHVFWSKGCPHCEKALSFFDRLEAEQPAVVVHRHEVSDSRENLQLFLRTAQKYQISEPGVPLVVIGGQYWLDYRDDSTTGQELRLAIQRCLQAFCPTENFSAAVPAGVNASNLPMVIAADRGGLMIPRLDWLM